MTSFNNKEGYFYWQSFNASAEPLILSWPASDQRKQYLNPTNYGNGTYFEFNLTSLSNTTLVYYYSEDAMIGNWSQAQALVTQTWVDLLQGNFIEPFTMFPSTATGYVDYKYEVNLTNNATAIEIDFIVEA